ncbi:MAG: hypothetical protein KME35_00285 [Aphanocapsa sp. GSE-SYN-MK-11-07L]|jgi:hypothetical protein|nr:hypothetical protein [Aphanocapsa sp. GSE-SYN-MK-11-07L]
MMPTLIQFLLTDFGGDRRFRLLSLGTASHADICGRLQLPIEAAGDRA